MRSILWLSKSAVMFFLLLIMLPAASQEKQSTVSQQKQPVFIIDTVAAKYSRVLTAKLSLDEKQRQKVQEAYVERHQKLQAVSTAPQDSAMRNKAVTAIHEEYEASLKKFLTNRQYQEYKNFTAETQRSLRERSAKNETRIKESN